MATYRNKQTNEIVEVMQWTDNTTAIINFASDKCSYGVLDTAWQVGKGIPHEHMYVYTKDGKIEAFRKDYFIKNILNGEVSIFKPDSFEENYVLVA